MEIINSEFRKNILSHCCEKKVYLGTQDCSGCLKSCKFLIDKPIAFHKWLTKQSDGQNDPIHFLIELLRKMIIEDQNTNVFELLDMVDIGEQQYNRAGLKRVAKMLLDTNIIENDLTRKAVNSIPKIKDNKNNNKLN
tara:strand:- start:15936 stop:16346 length:411 start_codon:yes stop_codon:yes gene_type:complete